MSWLPVLVLYWFHAASTPVPLGIKTALAAPSPMKPRSVRTPRVLTRMRRKPPQPSDDEATSQPPAKAVTDCPLYPQLVSNVAMSCGLDGRPLSRMIENFSD